VTPSIVWLRQDLRLADQSALAAAAGEGAVVPVYILDNQSPGRWKIGGAQRWWLHHSLADLARRLEEVGSRLILRRGESLLELSRLAEELGTRRVHALRHYEPWWRAAEQGCAAALDLVLHDGNVLVPPERVRTGGGRSYKIYTPYWRALQQHLPPPDPLQAPAALSAPEQWPRSDALESWSLRPSRPDWAAGFGEEWTPGETAAADRLASFAGEAEGYADRRNLPAEEGTSRLSPHLHFGEISPAQVWHALPGGEGDKFRKELAWRDFAQNVMLAQPRIGEAAGREAFEPFPWRAGPKADADFEAWTRGRTGYPIVDAGMRQLWGTGWMHNRVRMIAASFLVKHLLIDWRRGTRWFWDTLVDADYGNNGQNWQWIAGTGVDSQPFHRIMAPLAQSDKFAAADYIRRSVPELAGMSDAAVHDPGADRPSDYPPPIVAHREARERALAALRQFRASGSNSG
jgi:deoxyribodipyrimidine photo-lyase